LREPDMVDRMAALGMDLQENGTADYGRYRPLSNGDQEFQAAGQL